jgi:hypothetical protein
MSQSAAQVRHIGLAPAVISDLQTARPQFGHATVCASQAWRTQIGHSRVAPREYDFPSA